jgi:type 1 fimbriae regulatory protein FimB
MIKASDQTLKVEQNDLGEDVGQIIRFPNPDERRLVKPELAIAPPEKKGTSPNQGYAATGRTREYLTETEMDKLLVQSKQFGRASHHQRNYAIVLMTYRHGLRASEAADMRWSDIDFDKGTVLVRRCKGSDDSTHFLQGDELRALRKLQRESKPSPFIFGGMAETAISTLVKRLGGKAGHYLLGFPVHAHMLRHSCGYYLANKGIDTRTIQAYLGHKNIENTVRYTKLAPGKFKGLWS